MQFSRPHDRPLHVLCLGAHSDDIEIGCGGTVLRLLDEVPVIVTWVVFGAGGVRRDEALQSAEAFLAGAKDAHVRVFDFPNSYFPHEARNIKDRFEDLKKDLKPDVVLTHYRDDLHQDHRVIGELTWNTFRDHVILEYEIPKYDGGLGSPNVFVPLPVEVADRKIDLILTHFRSQSSRSWFTGETFAALHRIRGIECNAQSGRAEAFYSRKIVL